jgi:hypothetical protein
MIGDELKATVSNWKLKDERIMSTWVAWRVLGCGKDLNPGACATPCALHWNRAEAVVTSYLRHPGEQRALDLLAHALPLCGIECYTWLDGRDLAVSIPQHNSGLRAR